MSTFPNDIAGDVGWLVGRGSSTADPALAAAGLPDDHLGDIRITRDAMIFNLCSIAALTWVVYDFVLCFGREVSLVWGRWRELKGRHTRRLYILVRYFSILNLAWYVGVNTRFDITRNFPLNVFISPYHSCKIWHYLLVVNATAITLLPDAMILIRVNAVYNWNIMTLVLTTSLFFIQMATSLGIGVLTILSAPVIPPMRGLQRPGCVLALSPHHSKIALAAWIPSIAAQTIYFILMLKTLLHLMRGLDKKGAGRVSWENWIEVKRLVPTMVVFVRHGVAYFVFGISIKIINAVLLVHTSGPLQTIGISWMMALYPILICRIYLSMVDYLHSARRRRRHHLHANAHTDTEEDVDFTFSSTDESPGGGLGQIEFAARSYGSCDSFELEGRHSFAFGDEEY